MGKNKLHMIGKKTQKKKKKKSKKLTKKDKRGIVDVPLASKVSIGSKASVGYINYHYQKYYNTFAFIKEIIKKNKRLKKIVCIPNFGEGWMQSFLKVNFLKGAPNQSIKSLQAVDTMVNTHKFTKAIKGCMKHRFVPINLEIIVEGVGTHANILIIDTHKKTIELFEPHGDRGEHSDLESINKAYHKVSKKVEAFFKTHFDRLTYIPPSKYEPSKGLQARLDAFSGLCVTWSILYLHSRLLNPDVQPKRLLKYLDATFNRSKLLRYTQYVEDILKHKV
jgi:hypothetical protein